MAAPTAGLDQARGPVGADPGALAVALLMGAGPLAGCAPAGVGAAGGEPCSVSYVGERVGAGATPEVVLLDPEMRVVSVLAVDARSPSLSPDGRHAAYLQRVTGSESEWAVATIGLDGSGLRRPFPDTVDHADPSWSPDGSRILFRRLDGTPPDSLGRYVTAPVNGGRPTVLLKRRTDGAGFDRARFSPDGFEVVLTRLLGEVRDVVVADVGTREVVRGVAEGTSGVWSPGSDRLAVGGPGRKVDGAVPRVEVRGRRATAGEEVLGSKAFGTEVLVWGANGIVFRRREAGQRSRLWRADPAGLTASPFTAADPAVRPTAVVPGC